METNGIGALASLGMAVLTFPLALLLARLCLGGVFRMMSRPSNR